MYFSWLFYKHRAPVLYYVTEKNGANLKVEDAQRLLSIQFGARAIRVFAGSAGSLLDNELPRGHVLEKGGHYKFLREGATCQPKSCAETARAKSVQLQFFEPASLVDCNNPRPFVVDPKKEAKEMQEEQTLPDCKSADEELGRLLQFFDSMGMYSNLNPT